MWLTEVYSDLYIAKQAQPNQKQLLVVESHKFQKPVVLEAHLPWSSQEGRIVYGFVEVTHFGRQITVCIQLLFH